MRRTVLAALLALPLGGRADKNPQQPAFEHTEVAPGVHAFVFDNALGNSAGVDGTALVIINEDDVVVVDAQGMPVTARRIIAEIRKLTPKPVRMVVNTHWHGDHWLGNQAYQDAYPGVEFVAHVNMVADAKAEELSGLDAWRSTNLPAMITDYEQRLAKGIRRDGKPYSAGDSARVAAMIASLKWALPGLKEITPVLPTRTVTDSLVLHRGKRTIVIQHLGRGNTRGDLSVWLPREGVLATGDLLVNPAPYSFGSYLGEWMVTLGRLHTLPAKVIVPGHGAIQRDWAYVDLFMELLGSTLAQAKTAVAKGMDLEATRKAVDLSALRARFVKGDSAVAGAFDSFFIAPAVERAWLEARGELDKAPR